MAARRPASLTETPGLGVRRVAADILDGVLNRRRPLDEVLEAKLAAATLDERDRALTRQIVATALRRLGSLRHVLHAFLDRGFPKDAPAVEMALILGAAQILLLDVPDHAAVDLAVRTVQADRHAKHFTGLVNAVLRRVTREGKALLSGTDTIALDTPQWLFDRWRKAYGDETARAICAANGHEAALDLTVKSDPDGWAKTLSGRVLPSGSVRLIPHGPVTAMPGFSEGAWWVQDAAAALPAKLLGDVRGLRVADLCAAPGGKSAQLAHAGAHVTAVDRSVGRVARLRDNLARLGLHAQTVVADAAELAAGPFDAVLLDAPCSSTGTIRRHPDIPWLKQEQDLAGLTALQTRLLDRAVALTKPGGTLVYCVCSLEPEEGEGAIAALLARNADVRRRPIGADEIAGLSGFVTPAGDLRTLPSGWPDPEERFSGLDGFYAARLVRT